MVSAMVAGFSVSVYGGFDSAAGRSTGQASFASVVALANAAIEHGSATATLTLDRASIGCSANSLEFDSPYFSGDSALPVRCGFPPLHLSGLNRLTFSYSADQLTLQVR